MRHVGSSPDMFECYSRLPDDLLPAFIEAARRYWPTVAEYEGVTALARAVCPGELQTITERAVTNAARHSAYERLAIAYALAPENSLRSEEHTSELQSLMRISYAVFCLKKKNNQKNKHIIHTHSLK